MNSTRIAPASTGATATSPTGHRARLESRHLAACAYLVVLIGSAFAAYWAMFTEFAPYDDSGFFINSIRLFTQGQALYNRVFTDYGPFSYELWAALFGVFHQTISTDSGRAAVVGIWLFTSLLLGVSAQRLTGRLTLGLITQVLSFSALTALNAEPMHASGVICALFAVVVATVSFLLPHRQRAALALLGALLAALVLSKINVGGFACIAALYATVMAIPALQQRAALRWFAVAALVGVGPVLMASNLTEPWAQNYALLGAAGAIAIVLVTVAPQPVAIAELDWRRWTVWLLAGFAVCFVLVIGILVALGSTLGALIHDTVVVPSHQTTAFTLPISLSGDTIYWASGAVAAAWVIRQLRQRSLSQPSLVGPLCRIAAALAIWLSIVAADPLDLSPENANFALALTLAWVAAIPSSRDDGGGLCGRFVRLFLPAFASLEALMAYPVAGTQVMFGSLLLLVCGAVCFADGWSDLEAWDAARGAVTDLRASKTIMAALSTALVVAFAFQYVLRPMEAGSNAYSANPSLRIAGATRLHLPANQVATFTQIVTLLRARCHSLITLPGLMSFNLWSKLPAPSGLTAEPFWHLLGASQEASALASARVAPGLCAVINDQQAADWDNGKPTPQTPLVSYIEGFKPIAEYEGYVVSIRSR